MLSQNLYYEIIITFCKKHCYFFKELNNALWMTDQCFLQGKCRTALDRGREGDAMQERSLLHQRDQQLQLTERKGGHHEYYWPWLNFCLSFCLSLFSHPVINILFFPYFSSACMWMHRVLAVAFTSVHKTGRKHTKMQTTWTWCTDMKFARKKSHRPLSWGLLCGRVSWFTCKSWK